MINSERVKILVFSEEYVKTSIGMYNVWTSINDGLEKYSYIDIDVILNKEHWDNKYPKLTFTKPSNILRKIDYSINLPRFFSHLRYLIGVFIDTLFSPILLYLVLKRLATFNHPILVIHNGGWPGGQLSKYLLIAAKILSYNKIILVIHNYTNSYLPKHLFYIQRKILKFLINVINPLVVTVSHDLKSHIDLELEIESVMIWNGINVDNFTSPESASVLPLDNSDLQVIGFVATFIESKGSVFLKDVVNKISTPCHVIIIGHYLEEDKNKFLSDIDNNNCKITFFGFTENIIDIYSLFDIFINCSQELESFGLTACEAMRKKIPVICTDSGGMKEIVVDGVTGYVVNHNDSITFAQKIDFLLENSSKRIEMGEAGRLRFLKYFTSEIMTENYLQLVLKKPC
jgi:teichuronic acid biosynthesis glycosyltransferase TuaC